MNSIWTIFFCCMMTLNGNAQNPLFAWAKQMRGSAGAGASCITLDVAGNVYTTGGFGGTVDFDPGPGVHNLTASGTIDAFISKLDSAGNFIWVKQLGYTGIIWSTSIAIDVSGNLLLTGGFDSTVDFDPSPSTHLLTSLGGNDLGMDAFVCKLNAAGNFVWAKQISGADDGVGFSIATDASGNIYACGEATGSADYDPGPAVYALNAWGAFILKFDPSGNFVWAKTLLGMGFTAAPSITADASGNTYIAGWFTYAIDFDPGPANYTLSTASSQGVDTYVLKLNTTGNFVWVRRMAGSAVWEEASVSLDAFGNIFVAGTFEGAWDFDPGPGTANLVPVGSIDAFISKMDVNGNFIWVRQVGGINTESGNSLATDVSGSVYVTGFFQGSADFDGGPASYILNAFGFTDMFVSKLDAGGNFLWARQIGGPGNAGINNASITASSIAVDAIGSVYTTGSFGDTIDFDPGSAVYNLAPVGNRDIFVHKLKQCITSTSSVINVTACPGYTLNGQTFTASGTYTQTLVNSAGCDSILTLNLIFETIDSTINVATCKRYTWNNQVYYTNGSYNDTLLSSRGCDSIVTYNFSVNIPSTSVTVSTCSSYAWNNQVLTASGTYRDTLSTPAGCDSFVTLNLLITPPPASTIIQTICSGQTYLGYSTSGTYVDTLTTSNGCDSIRTLQLTVLPKPAPDLGSDKILCTGDSLVLHPGQFLSYNWQDGSSQSHLTIKQPGTYNVIVTTACGSATDFITVTNSACDVYFPSAFTPDGDGRNDRFKVLGAHALKNYHLIVYNRWGQKVFETFDPANGWDGTLNGREQLPSAFAWYCKFNKTGNAEKTRMKGVVILIR